MIFFVGMAIIILSRFYVYFEQVYASKKKRPFFLNFFIFRNKLKDEQECVLENQFTFYQRLTDKEKAVFKHRVARFIKEKEFIGRQDLIVTDEIKTLISATAVMLTFGFKNYLLNIINTVIIYPESFYSKINDANHKGEINPRLGLIALSWKDFKRGFDISNDNLNLGVHEFGHALHLNSFKNDDISAMIFSEGFSDLKTYLRENESIRQKLIKSHYFRAYAFTNEFEFASVLIECFIETPKIFKSQFPKLYLLTKQMLNFNFAGY
ncbi:zinc-dependent peptidase [Winogradskyella sp. E313]|uniref:Zinc-dependent peptidase n=2 Tax=Winogradskyella immobilis TaxID=2816852 RepID=A0ABS8EJ32_9FLAO|nr:zinc-dependent peptidase [Winogradskyella immobilis]